MLNAARLLVTGASGFLGAHLVERSNAAGLHVVAQVHRAGAQSSWLHDVTTIRADFAVLGEVERCLASVKPTCVIHSAALSGLVDCERDLQLAQAVNVHASRALADWCVRNGARLVHVSTDLVFGGTPTPKGGFKESDEAAPISVYGRTKLAAERAVQATDPSALIVRLPLLVGPSHARGLGASDSVLAAVDRGETPALCEDEWRTPLDVRSAAEALIELAATEFCGVLHVAGPERMSRYEIGIRALRQRGLRDDQARAKIVCTTRVAAGLAATRPADVSLNSTRARSVLKTILVGLESGSH